MSADKTALWSIPACAGDPHRVVSSGRVQRVYPRVCGGTFELVLHPRLAEGLSPRVRGNPAQARSENRVPRSIPACAGEPPCPLRQHGLCAVYPRVCGGTPEPCKPITTNRGLSPRVRGNPSGGAAPYMLVGSIPACAGEPDPFLFVLVVVPVYPRVCGGTLKRLCFLIGESGLSPRVRGNHMDEINQVTNPRSIPACAGEPL